ncbi:hypothetical protein [Microbacterium sp. NPDC056569]|uniref:hypothetical protein n=1 Tax=Microbacterium sp. NPDC056569 TaxID=3345867 RepID=UPI0036728299
MPTPDAFPRLARADRAVVRPTRGSGYSVVPPTGRAGRALILAASTAICGTGAVALLLLGLQENSVAWIMAAAPLLLVYAWAWVRFPWIGVYVGDDGVIVRSWWRTRRLNKVDMSRWNADSYTGWLYVAGWPVAGGALEPGHLRLSTVDDRSITLGGTVTWRSTARRQAFALNDWLGVQRLRTAATAIDSATAQD